MPQRNRYLFVCTNRRPDSAPKGSCAARGSERVLAALKREVAARGLATVEARVCGSTCQDVCWAGPVVAVSPDGYFYGRVLETDAADIAQALAEGRRVERLVLPPADFTMETAAPPVPTIAPEGAP